MKRVYFLQAGILLCMGCASESLIDTDYCPDDPNKTVPGICGCGLSDDIDPETGSISCLNGKDYCPDDPDKDLPGICGCGVPDEKDEATGIVKCLLDGVDLCPGDPNKTLPGVCGCGVSDELDPDSGEVSCSGQVDLCPDDPDKTQPGVCGCGFKEEKDPETGDVQCPGSGVDLCPDDDEKDHPGICGCGVRDDIDPSTGIPVCLSENIDLCPDDDDKVEPGVCGCGVKDDIDPNTGIPVCLSEDIDLCPENDEKKLPGVCGCKESDEIDINSGVPSCLSNSIDLCPDSDKQFPGLCGCSIEDSVENVGDDDHDGVINCLDICPQNPTKADSEGASGCSVLDSDRDGVDDEVDACPYNPDIKTLKSEVSGEIKCNDNTEQLYQIWSAQELMDLEKTVLTPRAKSKACTAGAVSCYSNGKTYLSTCAETNIPVLAECQDSCSVDALTATASCKTAEVTEPVADVKIELMADINLADGVNWTMDASGCAAEWTSLSALTNVEFEGHNHTIRFSVKGQQCALSNALFSAINASKVSNLNLAFDIKGAGNAMLASMTTASVLDSISIDGKVSTSSTGGIGGLVSSAKASSVSYPVAINNCYAKRISIEAENTTSTSYIGGLVGTVNAGVLLNWDKELTHTTSGIKSKGKTGGVVGSLAGTSSGALNVVNSDISGGSYVGGYAGNCTGDINAKLSVVSGAVSATASYAGGAIGRFSGVLTEALSVVVDSVSAGNNYTGGAMGLSEMSVSNISVESGSVQGSNYVGGIVGYLKGAVLNNVKCQTKTISGLNYVGGVAGRILLSSNKNGSGNSSSEASFGEITSRIESISGRESVGGFVGAYAPAAGTKATLKSIHISSGKIQGESSVGGLIGSHLLTALKETSSLNLSNISVHANVFAPDAASMAGLFGSFALTDTSTYIQKTEGVAISVSVNKVTTAEDGKETSEQLNGPYIMNAVLSETDPAPIIGDNFGIHRYSFADDEIEATGTDVFDGKVKKFTSAEASSLVKELGSEWALEKFELAGKMVELPAYISK